MWEHQSWGMWMEDGSPHPQRTTSTLCFPQIPCPLQKLTHAMPQVHVWYFFFFFLVFFSQKKKKEKWTILCNLSWSYTSFLYHTNTLWTLVTSKNESNFEVSFCIMPFDTVFRLKWKILIPNLWYFVSLFPCIVLKLRWCGHWDGSLISLWRNKYGLTTLIQS